MFHIIYALLVFLGLALVPGANALTFRPAQLLGNVFSQLYSLTQNVYVLYGVSFIVVFILLYYIFFAGMKKIPGFGGSEKLIKPIALCISAIATMGIFYKAGSARAAVERIVEPIGAFGGLAFALVMFALVYYNLDSGGERSFTKAFFAAGLAMALWGLMMNNEELYSWGVILIIISAIMFLWNIIPKFNVFGEDGGAEGAARRQGALTTRAPGQAVSGIGTPGRVYNIRTELGDATSGDVNHIRGHSRPAAIAEEPTAEVRAEERTEEVEGEPEPEVRDEEVITEEGSGEVPPTETVSSKGEERPKKTVGQEIKNEIIENMKIESMGQIMHGEYPISDSKKITCVQVFPHFLRWLLRVENEISAVEDLAVLVNSNSDVEDGIAQGIHIVLRKRKDKVKNAYKAVRDSGNKIEGTAFADKDAIYVARWNSYILSNIDKIVDAYY